MALGEVASGLESGAGPKFENESLTQRHVQEQFHGENYICSVTFVQYSVFMEQDIVITWTNELVCCV